MNIQIRGTVRKRADGTIDTEELIIELKDRSGKRQGWCLAVPYLRQGDYPAVESEGDPYQAGVKAMYDKLVGLRRRTQAKTRSHHCYGTPASRRKSDFRR